MRITKTFSQLKYNRRAVFWILAIDLALAISSTVVDWPWLIRVPRHLVFFAPICSLYPWLLVIWFTIWHFKKRVPAWFSNFLFIGLFSYGWMAWLYYPLIMTWNGFSWHDVGAILWVTAYGIQCLIIASEVKKIPWWQFLPVAGYFFFKDISDRFFGTFLDVMLDSYPENFKIIFFAGILALHAIAIAIVLRLQKINRPNQHSTH